MPVRLEEARFGRKGHETRVVVGTRIVVGVRAALLLMGLLRGSFPADLKATSRKLLAQHTVEVHGVQCDGARSFPLNLLTAVMENNLREEEQRVLRLVYDLAGADCKNIVSAQAIGQELRLPPAQLFGIIERLSSSQLLEYVGAGPRVCITDAGVIYMRALRLAWEDEIINGRNGTSQPNLPNRADKSGVNL